MSDRTYAAIVLLTLSAWSWLTTWPWYVDSMVLSGLVVLAYVLGTPE